MRNYHFNDVSKNDIERIYENSILHKNSENTGQYCQGQLFRTLEINKIIAAFQSI